MWRLVGICGFAIVFGLSVNAHAANNLVPNGSFEQVALGAARFPVVWEFEKASPLKI